MKPKDLSIDSNGAEITDTGLIAENFSNYHRP